MTSRVAVVGPFPPPVHGMAVMNESVARALSGLGVEVEKLDTATCRGGVWGRIGRVVPVAIARRQLLAGDGKGDAVAWVSVSGGLGKVHEIALVHAARRAGMRVVLHHHTWTNVRRKSGLMATLTQAAGPDHIQIALCEKMARRLEELYRPPDVRVISNLAFLDLPTLEDGAGPRIERGARVFGYLSNITLEKGIGLALELGEQILALHPECRIVVAGPVHDHRAKRLLARYLRKDHRFEYRGPVYGEAKERFFTEVDVLLFPSMYRNETEPLVVLEALIHNVPVLATDIGCIKEMVGPVTPVFSHDSYLGGAAHVAVTWVRDIHAYSEVRKKCSEQIRRLREEAISQLSDALSCVR